MKNIIKLDKEEQELLDLFEAGRLPRSSTADADIEKAKIMATAHNKKDSRINIRISKYDLERIKRAAIKEGMPYQTLISSLLHKYADSYSL